jgi:hypothetical protein
MVNGQGDTITIESDTLRDETIGISQLDYGNILFVRTRRVPWFMSRFETDNDTYKPVDLYYISNDIDELNDKNIGWLSRSLMRFVIYAVQCAVYLTIALALIIILALFKAAMSLGHRKASINGK